ncbi:MAG: 3-deoxy-manno-octulosonate cytidylyltransferase [Saprospiraceae bacterium]|nr:3-deoxy-manno-octulosonate cytidylyltransferase [Saprospiraceae bacterium]
MNENMPKTIALIPARFDSTRLPGKLLLPLGDKSILKSVYDRALLCKTLDTVAVVTDHPEIFKHVQSWGGNVYMSDPQHQSGTDRIAEIAAQLHEFSYVVNLQGDEPFMEPMAVDYLMEIMVASKASIGTLISRINTTADFMNPNVVKVVRNIFGSALYFSRASIPFHRDLPPDITNHEIFRHIGLYIFERETLLKITKTPVSNLESIEKLEQLRWLEQGYQIITAQMDLQSFGIDTQSDYDAAVKRISVN